MQTQSQGMGEMVAAVLPNTPKRRGESEKRSRGNEMKNPRALFDGINRHHMVSVLTVPSLLAEYFYN